MLNHVDVEELLWGVLGGGAEDDASDFVAPHTVIHCTAAI